MNIELVSIGDELLKGSIVNTNVSFLGRHLLQAGYRVTRQTTLPDKPEALREGLKDSIGRADLVIATGGLGPTLDDGTREIAAELFSSPLHLDSTIAEDIRKRFAGVNVSVENQATVPSKAKIFPNAVGTAPGLLLSEKGKHLVLLPGVPREMEPMFLEKVLPWVQKQWPQALKKASSHLYFCLIYESLLDPYLRALAQKYPAVEVGIYSAHGLLSVALHSENHSQLNAFEKDLTSRYGIYIYSSPSGKLEEAIHEWFVKHRKKLAFAESCTGGMLASFITSLPGASDYFLGSFVVYSNEMKQQALGVSKTAIETHGSVSEEVAREMLAGVFAKSSADFAIAVTGFTGPTGGAPGKPVGTICVAIGERGKTADVGTFQVFGNRQTMTLLATQWLLGALWRKVEKGIPVFPFIP